MRLDPSRLTTFRSTKSLDTNIVRSAWKSNSIDQSSIIMPLWHDGTICSEQANKVWPERPSAATRNHSLGPTRHQIIPDSQNCISISAGSQLNSHLPATYRNRLLEDIFASD